MGIGVSHFEEARRRAPRARESEGPQSERVASPAVIRDVTLTGSALTVLVPVRPGDEWERKLRMVLTGESSESRERGDGKSGKDAKAYRDALRKKFDQLETVHFMRWVVLPPASGSKQALLAFESNYDGSLDDHLNDLHRVAPKFLHDVYSCCEGYSPASSDFDGAGDGAAVKALLTKREHLLPYAAFYVSRRKKPARQIRDEAAIHDAIQAFLDALGPDPARKLGERDAPYDKIIEHLTRVKPRELARLLESPRKHPHRNYLSLAWRLGPLALAVLAGFVPLWIGLRRREKTDAEDSYGTMPAKTLRLVEREDLQVQNQLTHLVEVKPGRFRLLTLRTVLWAIDVLARYRYTAGDLGGLTTIHYARWVLIDDGDDCKRLLFFSNYDGSWERYLGDFIDQAHVGLTGIWSNTKGFPKTFGLIGAGAKDEERFKAWTRAHQVESDLWYSAYGHLTTRNVWKNSAICDGIVTPPASAEERERWLSLL
jgi:hypothetical protein